VADHQEPAGHQDDIVKANRGALKAEASARLERLQFKKDEHIRLCDVRCGKYNDYVKIEPCRSLVALAALRAQHGTDLKACAEALRDQIRVRVHVYKIKAAGLSQHRKWQLRGGRAAPRDRAACGGCWCSPEEPAPAGSIPDPRGAPSADC